MTNRQVQTLMILLSLICMGVGHIVSTVTASNFLGNTMLWVGCTSLVVHVIFGAQFPWDRE